LRGMPYQVSHNHEHDVVYLHEPNSEPLLTSPQVRHADRARIDPSLPSSDLLIGHHRVMDLLAVKIAIAHHLVAAEHLGVEFEGAIHVLDRKAEVLHSLESGAERRVVAVSRNGERVWTGGILG